MSYPLPLNDAERIEALRRYEILDTAVEQCFDDLAKLASYICGTPIAYISLVDEKRQWFKSRVGIEETETSREVAFCSHAIMGDEILVIPDATEDSRFRANPLVLSEPRIRFYAGAPLVTPEGHAVGTLCVVDRQPRQLTESQYAALVALSRQVVTQLELRRNARRLKNLLEENTDQKLQLLDSAHRLYEEQLKRIEQQHLAEAHGLQLKTLREVTLTLMDRINNPLAIMMVTIEQWRRSRTLSAELLEQLDTLQSAVRRVSASLQEAASLKTYRTMATSFGNVLDVYSPDNQPVIERPQDHHHAKQQTTVAHCVGGG